MNLNSYKTALFDCDGVIFDSNHRKKEIFIQIASQFGEAAVKIIKNHLNRFPGMSRYNHLNAFISEIQKEGISPPSIEQLLEMYSGLSQKVYQTCKISKHLDKLKMLNTEWNWAVVSSSDQNELRKVFKEKKIDIYFNLGIFGSPMSKIQIIDSLLDNSRIYPPVVFFGDSVMDYEVAKKYNFDFIFVSDWTSVNDWKSFCLSQKIYCIKNLDSLII